MIYEVKNSSNKLDTQQKRAHKRWGCKDVKAKPANIAAKQEIRENDMKTRTVNEHPTLTKF